ncbi:MAG TPA: hypothetical protein VEQ61_07085 [Thermoleophilaceae bacterium]|nr:hypothetical protein [Thermoleophilaceae bacterium]
MPTPPTSLSIRLATAADAPAIARLVELEEAAPLSGPALLGEHDGTIVAALSLEDDRAVADIFLPTQSTVLAMRHWRDEQHPNRPNHPKQRRLLARRLRIA